MAQSPSSECISPGLNWTESQQGQMCRSHSTRGSQFGQILIAGFTGNLPSFACSEDVRLEQSWNAQDEKGGLSAL